MYWVAFIWHSRKKRETIKKQLITDEEKLQYKLVDKDGIRWQWVLIEK